MQSRNRSGAISVTVVMSYKLACLNEFGNCAVRHTFALWALRYRRNVTDGPNKSSAVRLINKRPFFDTASSVRTERQLVTPELTTAVETAHSSNPRRTASRCTNVALALR